MKLSAISVPIKKFLFLAFGKLWVMDPIRNFVYQWAWSFLRSLPRSASILDIGTRNSQFAAWCAWRGFSVTAIDKDERFHSWQDAFKQSWRVEYRTMVSDVLTLDRTMRFDCILALFSLQHAGEGDSAAYRRAFSLLKPGGTFLIVNEYNSERTTFQPARDDGALRVYGPSDIAERIEKPLLESGAELSGKSFARADFKKGLIRPELDHAKSTICFIIVRKPSRL
jgi:SAM-dependent methyltransferase